MIDFKEVKDLQKQQRDIFAGIRNDIQNYRDVMLGLIKEYERENIEAIERFKKNINKKI